MPTGYTSKLYDGEQDFDDFALGVARGFGAFVHQRDDSSNSPPRLAAPYDDAADRERLESAKADLARYYDMSVTDIVMEQEREHREALLAWEEAVVERAKLKNRYERMLDQVKAWEPPSNDHVKFKEYMVEQLEQSIEFDCKGYERYMPQLVTADEYRQQRKDMARRMIDLYQENITRDRANNDQRRLWGAQLFESLGVYDYE